MKYNSLFFKTCLPRAKLRQIKVVDHVYTHSVQIHIELLFGLTGSVKAHNAN